MSKTATDRYQRQLQLLLKEPGNDECADCKARNPRWASWDQGVFLCVQCASMHRKIGSHVTKVKSVTLDKWTKEQVENMRKLGNVKVNSMLNPDERRHPPPPQDSGDERNSQLERFIRNKYEYRTFAAPASSANGYSNGSTAPPRPAAPGSSFTSPSTAADPVPPLPRRPAQPASSAFDDFSSAFGPPAASTSSSQPFSPGPTLPPRPPLSHVAASAPAPIAAPTPRAKSVRFPEAPPTFIPSPPDSDDEDDVEPHTSPPRPSLRPRARSASAHPPRKGILRFRPGGNDEILVDWAALTSPPPGADGEDEEDVPLASLGALGMRGAQVGMAAVPAPQGGGYIPYPGTGQQQGMWAVPYGGPSGQGQAAQGGNPPPVAPLQPQYTGSAKGYLHQQRQQQAQALQPQQTGTGIDAFQQLFQPPAPSQPQQSHQPPFSQPQQQYSQLQLAQPQARTNPFHAHLFARNAYSPSPQPPSSAPSPQPPQPPQQQQAPPQQPPLQQPPQQGQTAKTMNDIWADLDLLGGSSFSSAPQPSTLHLQAPSFGNAPTPSPSIQPNPPAPAPLRPQLTGFVPSSSFGQQLARESSPFPPSASLTVPNATAGSSRFASPGPFDTPQPLQPQRTGFVPSSAFGQELARDFGGGSGAPSPALNAPAPAPLQPQRTGFVPSSRFGLELAKESGGNAANGSLLGTNGATGDGRSVSPAPFDFTPSPARTPQPPTTNPFSTFSSSLNAALPPSQPSPPQQQQQMRPNPFLQPQLTGFNPTQQPMRPQQTGYFPTPQQQNMPPQMQMGLQPQLTGFQGGGVRPPGGNPFLAFGQANGGQAGWQQ
ncbi:Protein gts1 [Rhodotorula toruloides]